MNRTLFLFVSGLAAGVMNAAAGGGTFVAVPALIWAGVPSISANMSSTLALYPGTLTSAWAYRKHLQTIHEVSLKALGLSTLVGGFGGALLLLLTPSSSFDKIIPWLLLMGSITFAFGGKIGERLQRVYQPNTAALLTAQFLLGVYGGYFGGAAGIMMMAVWSVLGVHDIKTMNAVRVVMITSANTVAVLCFAIAGSIAWHDTLVMLVAAAAGGYIGARIALKLQSSHLRIGISAITFLITAAFFYAKFFK